MATSITLDLTKFKSTEAVATSVVSGASSVPTALGAAYGTAKISMGADSVVAFTDVNQGLTLSGLDESVSVAITANNKQGAIFDLGKEKDILTLSANNQAIDIITLSDGDDVISNFEFGTDVIKTGAAVTSVSVEAVTTGSALTFANNADLKLTINGTDVSIKGAKADADNVVTIQTIGDDGKQTTSKVHVVGKNFAGDIYADSKDYVYLADGIDYNNFTFKGDINAIQADASVKSAVNKVDQLISGKTAVTFDNRNAKVLEGGNEYGFTGMSNTVNINLKNQAADTFVLGNNNKYVDTVTMAADYGRDTVKNFTGILKDSTADILNLKDTTDLNKVEFTNNEITFDVSNSIEFKNASADMIKVQLKDGSIKRVAGIFNDNSLDTINIDVNASTDVFYGLVDNSTNTKVALTENVDYYQYTNDTDNTAFAHTKGASIAEVTMNNAKKDGNYVVTDVQKVTTNDQKGSTNIVWAYTTNDAEFTLGAEKNAADFVGLWDGVDQKVTVTNFTTADTAKAKEAADVLWLVGNGNGKKGEQVVFTSDLASVVKNFKFSSDGTDVKVASNNETATELTLAGVASGVFNVRTGYTSQSDYKVAIAQDNVAFATDVNVFAAAKVTSDLSVGNYVIAMDTKSADVTDTTKVFSGVTEFDASTSKANYTVTGSDKVENIIRTSKGTNTVYGGGSADDSIYSNGTDTVIWGKNDGYDRVYGLGDNDTIALSNISSTDINTVLAVKTEGKNTLIVADGNNATLALQNTDVEDLAKITVTTSDAKTYNYNVDSKQFVVKA